MNQAFQVAQATLDQAHDYIAADAAALWSIFSLIKPPNDGDPELPSTNYMHPHRFNLDRTILFPNSEAADPQAVRQLFAEYRAAVARLTTTEQVRLEQQLSLLHEYGWALPSTEAAVSLYDKVRTVAAINAATADGSTELLLLGGDLSGIQQFIYRIAPTKAAKSLRARSLYLQLLTDALAHYIRCQAGMPLTNLLYSGGGRFFLLLPQSAEERIPGWRKQLGEFLLATHQGEIYVALGGTTFKADQNEFKDVWRAANEAIIDDKQRRFAALDADTLAKVVFAPRGHKYQQTEDETCGICRTLVFHKDLHKINPEDDADSEMKYCSLCKSLVDLGRRLPTVDVLVVQEQAPQLEQFELRDDGIQRRYAFEDVLAALGLTCVFAEHERVHPRDTQRLLLLTPQAIDQVDWYRQTYSTNSIHIRPMVNVVARNEADKVTEFDTLTKVSTGIQRLGVLRMDVDDLGDIFSFAMPETTLARTSTLSSAMARFFEGWVGVICQDINEQATNGQGIYSVYSGGDDVFFVGSWNLMPQLATRISRDLQAYAANVHIHVSAGLSLHSAKYPLYQAARESEAALEAAKHIPGKNGFGFLEQAVCWEYMGSIDETLDMYLDMPDQITQLNSTQLTVWALVNQLTGSIGHADQEQSKGLSRATLQVLQELYSQYRETLAHPRQNFPPDKVQYGPWMWRGEYQLGRMQDQSKQKPRSASLLKLFREHLKKHIDGTQPHTGQRMIERYGLAARWVQLLQRKENRDAND